MTEPRARAVPGLIAAALGLLFLRALLAPAPADYPSMRTAARAYLASFDAAAEPGVRVYDVLELSRWCARDGFEGALGIYVPQPPAALLPYLPIAPLPAHAGKVAFGAASLALFLATFLRLARALGVDGKRGALVLAATGGAVTANLANGQEMLIVAALLQEALRALLGNREPAAGAALGAAAGLKLFGLPWLALWIVERRIVALVVASAAVAVPTLAVGAGFGAEMLVHFASSVLPAALAGDFHNLYHPETQSVETVLRRLLLPHPDWNPAPPFPAAALYGVLSRAWPLALLLVALAGALRGGRARAAEGHALLLVAGLLAAPAVTRYHLAALAPVLLVVMARGSTRLRGAALAGAALASWAPQGPGLLLQEPRLAGLALVAIATGLLCPPPLAVSAALVSAALATGVLLPASRGSVPAEWSRVTAVPYLPLHARLPARDGSALELAYVPRDGRTAFHWPGYARDRSPALETVWERLEGVRSVLVYEDARGEERRLASLPDADCRRPRFLRPGLIRFETESGTAVATLRIDARAGVASPEADLPDLGTPWISAPDVSPDGSRVAYAVRRGRNTEIREHRLAPGAGEDPEDRILVPAVAWSIDPRYAWDGQRLYFASDAGRCAGCTVIYEIAVP